MTAPDEKAREIANALLCDWYIHGKSTVSRVDKARLMDAITAALIEARRVALEEAAKAVKAHAEKSQDLSERDLDDVSFAYLAGNKDAADVLDIRIRALIPIRPDGAAEGAEK